MGWQKVDKATVFEGKDENGNRYLSQFLRDYKQAFPESNPNAGCRKCLDDYYRNLIKHVSIMKKIKNESGYVLKAKYQNIPLKFGSPILVNNSNITKEHAQELLKRKNGKDLFQVIPEAQPEVENLSKLTRAQLDERATALGLDAKSYANKEEVINAIEAVESVNNEPTGEGTE